MIKVLVYMENDSDEQKYVEIGLTSPELKQIACNKARGEYGHIFSRIVAVSEDIKIESKL